LTTLMRGCRQQPETLRPALLRPPRTNGQANLPALEIASPPPHQHCPQVGTARSANTKKPVAFSIHKPTTPAARQPFTPKKGRTACRGQKRVRFFNCQRAHLNGPEQQQSNRSAVGPANLPQSSGASTVSFEFFFEDLQDPVMLRSGPW